MNYRHIYMLIIEHAKSEQKLGIRVKGNGNYYEKHHILPKSIFPLWKKRKENLVLLTAREHFFCHQLLTKIFPSNEMITALFFLCNDNQNNTKTSSNEYAKIREQHYYAQKNLWEEKSEEFKKQFRKDASIRMKNIWKNRTKQEKSEIINKSSKNRIDQEHRTDAMLKARRLYKDEISKKISDAWINKETDKVKLSTRCKCWNKDEGIIKKRSETIKKIMQEKIKDPNNDLKARLAAYNEVRKVKVLCIETGVVYPSISNANYTLGYLKLNVSKGILECEKFIDGQILHFKILPN